MVRRKVAIVGLGKMGIMHAANVSVIPDTRIVAVADAQPQLAHHVHSLGVEAPFYTSIEKMLEHTDLDAVFVCTPAAAHLAAAQACARRGIHMFVEKPLADTLENARRMCELAASSGIVNATGYMKAHYPLYQRMRALVQGGTLGRVHQCHCAVYLSQVFRPPKGWVYSKEASGGGIVINSTCHLLFLLHWFFGPARGVFARTSRIHSEVEDIASCVLDLDNEIVASVETSWAVPGYSTEYTRMLIVGDRGSLEINDDRARLFLNEKRPPYDAGWTAFHRSEVDRAAVDLSAEYGGEGYYNEDADFLDCCAGGRRPVVSWEEGLQVQRIVDAIYRSAENGYVRL